MPHEARRRSEQDLGRGVLADRSARPRPALPGGDSHQQPASRARAACCTCSSAISRSPGRAGCRSTSGAWCRRSPSSRGAKCHRPASTRCSNLRTSKHRRPGAWVKLRRAQDRRGHPHAGHARRRDALFPGRRSRHGGRAGGRAGTSLGIGIAVEAFDEMALGAGGDARAMAMPALGGDANRRAAHRKRRARGRRGVRGGRHERRAQGAARRRPRTRSAMLRCNSPSSGRPEIVGSSPASRPLTPPLE